MASVRVEMLVVLAALTGALVPVRGLDWEPIDGAQLVNLYETGQRSQPQSFTSSVTSSDDRSDYDSDDAVLEDAFPEIGGGSTSENVNPFANHGFQVEFVDAPARTWEDSTDEFVDAPARTWEDNTDEFVDAPPRTWEDGTDGDFVNAPPRTWEGSTDGEFVDAPPRSWTSSTSPSSSGLEVVCSENGFQITLLTGSLNDVKVLGSKELLSVMDAPESCGYEVNSLQNTLMIPLTGCNVKHLDGYSLQLLYVDAFDQTQVATASCEENLKFDSSLFPRASGKPKSKCTNPKALNCAVTSGERVTCGQPGISSSDCEKMGCCVDSSSCYYPLDECTGDQHFVFAIRSDAAVIPLDPTKLAIPGSPNCKPVIVNDKVAIFKFKVTECGTRAYSVGETKIYLAEVQTIVKALNLKYGVITRNNPLRFMVECRYSKSGTAQQSLASVGYMVKTPSSKLPTSVTSNGLYGVQLRIAKDQTYSSYLPTINQPLRLLLGKPVYLELLLLSPKPDAVILVNYCLAYPRSAKNALVLIYEGCANPYDPNVSTLKVSDLPKNRHQRRFVVQAFQFMDQKTNKYLNEEIYFMCSTEVCRPTEKTCVERCFDGKAR